MKLQESILDRYLYHVGKELHPNSKDDILKELKANVYDQLEAANGTLDDENAVSEVLLALGSPRQIAQSYNNRPKAIIDAAYVDIYWNIVKYALMGIAIAFLVLGGLEIYANDFSTGGITKALLGSLARIWNSGLAMIGTVTLIFAGITHYQLKEDSEGVLPASEVWDQEALRNLGPVPESKSIVKVSEMVTSIVGTIVGFLILNGMAFGSQGNIFVAWFNGQYTNTTLVGVLNIELLRSYMLLINSLFAANFALSTWLLMKGTWQGRTRLLSVGLDVVGTLVFLLVWLSPGFMSLDNAKGLLDPKLIDTLGGTLNFTTYIVAVVVVMTTLFSIYEHVKNR